MARRPLLTAVAYVAATMVVLLLGLALVSVQHSTLLQGEGKSVALLAGAALLLLGAGRLIFRAFRGLTRHRGR
ncbi:hypothetical protein ABT369_42930 [Dactylosporangium sp. NPDC000244]|uniref:hypothetical protein n=1 Tax=Dactylosporangium sp. NPDC000244 TaxID=3154365 RepID=UPI00331A3FE9